MAICMAKTIKEERLRWIMPIINSEIRLVYMAKSMSIRQKKFRKVAG